MNLYIVDTNTNTDYCTKFIIIIIFIFRCSLDPEEDPLCTLLLMDYYCIKAEEYTYFVQLYEEYEALRQISMLPNFLYSYALALFHMGRLEEADATVRSLFSVLELLRFILPLEFAVYSR